MLIARQQLLCGVKGGPQGPIPHQYFCLHPSYLSGRGSSKQQAWFSVAVLPFLPLSCGRSNPAPAPRPQDSNIQCCQAS